MKGYKGMDANMQCRGMQFEVGKTYHVDGDIKVCENGLHFCEQLIKVFDFYERNDSNRFFEIEASGTIKTDLTKSAASDMRIIRELSDIEVNRTVYEVNRTVYNNGCGNGNGDGNGYGDGYGNGCGYGYGDGDGNGDGYGNIQKILLFV